MKNYILLAALATAIIVPTDLYLSTLEYNVASIVTLILWAFAGTANLVHRALEFENKCMSQAVQNPNTYGSIYHTYRAKDNF